MLKALTFTGTNTEGFMLLPSGQRLCWDTRPNGTRYYFLGSGGIVWDPDEVYAEELLFAQAIENHLVLDKAKQEYDEAFKALIARSRTLNDTAVPCDAAADTLPSECPTGPRC